MTIKNKMLLHQFKIRNIYNEYKLFLKAGMIIWLGIAFIALAIGVSKENQHKYTFASETPTTETALKNIDARIAQNKPFTVVLHKTGCVDCKHAQNDLMRSYFDAKGRSKSKYIFIDLANASSNQKQLLVKELPNITVDGRQFFTPTVANYAVKDHKAQLVGISQSANAKSYRATLNQSKDLGRN